MRIFETVADVRAAVGEHFGYSDWHLIDQEQVNAFAEATGDRQWIHVDPSRAAAGPFGTTVAHGFLTLSLVPLLSGEIYQVRNITMGINYGLNKVRFPAPLPTGSRIRAGLKLISAEEASGGGVQLVADVAVEREGHDKPCCVAQTVTLLYG